MGYTQLAGGMDLSIEAIRENAARQLGLRETDKTIFSRKKTGIITLTVGEWNVIDAILADLDAKNTGTTNEIPVR